MVADLETPALLREREREKERKKESERVGQEGIDSG